MMMIAGGVFLAGISLIRYRSKRKVENETYGSGSLHLRCGTRKSALAMWQTRWVSNLMTKLDPIIKITILDGVDTMADKTLNVSLKELVKNQENISSTDEKKKQTSPGLFTKELEEGLYQNRYDFVVHSLKDIPTTLPDGLVIVAIGEREDPRDCVVFRDRAIKNLMELKSGAIIGTSSVRREALLRRDYPQFKIKLIRGNVNTRLAKLDMGEYDAILLAFAGMKRLGFEERVGQILNPDHFPYGVGQGSLGIECREVDIVYREKLDKLNHPPSSERCRCERALLRELEGGCQVPLGVQSRVFYSAVHEKRWLEVTCQILSLDGRVTVSGELSGPAEDCENLGVRLGVMLRDQGGAKHLIKSDDSWSDHQVISKPVKRPLTYGSAE